MRLCHQTSLRILLGEHPTGFNDRLGQGVLLCWLKDLGFPPCAKFTFLSGPTQDPNATFALRPSILCPKLYCALLPSTQGSLRRLLLLGGRRWRPSAPFSWGPTIARVPSLCPYPQKGEVRITHATTLLPSQRQILRCACGVYHGAVTSSGQSARRLREISLVAIGFPPNRIHRS